jgi:hypothetical protein
MKMTIEAMKSREEKGLNRKAIFILDSRNEGWQNELFLTHLAKGLISKTTRRSLPLFRDPDRAS